MLQTSYPELCERRGWTFVEKAPKAAIKHLVAVLQPPVLKSRDEDALRLEKNDLKDDFFGFADFLADEAEVCEKYHPLRAYRSSPKSNRAKGTEDEKKTRLSSSSYQTSGKGEKPKLPDCLNPDCNQKHFVKDCKITSDEKKKTVLEAHRADKKENKNFQGTRVSALLDRQNASARSSTSSLQSRPHHRRAP